MKVKFTLKDKQDKTEKHFVSQLFNFNYLLNYWVNYTL